MQLQNYLKNTLSLSSMMGRIRLFLGIGILLFPLLFGSLTLFPDTWVSIGLTSTSQVILGLILIISSLFEAPKHNRDVLSITALLLTFVYLASDLPIRRYGYFEASFPLTLYLAVLIFCFYLNHFKSRFLERYFSFICIAICLIGFFSKIKTSLIFTDDHPSFLYRLIQLKNNFPAIPFYNPSWNAGVEAREFFASGVLNVFLVFSPFIYLFELENIYSAIVAITLFVLLPLSFYQASRILKCSKLASSISVILALSHSLLWYRWALSYGTMGFVLSMILVPLNLALLCNFAEIKSNVTMRRSLMFSVLISLMLFWSLSFVVFLPVGLISLIFIFKSKNLHKFLLSCGVIFILTCPWAYVFYHASNVGKFVSVTEIDVKSKTEVAGFESSKFRVSSRSFNEKGLVDKILYTVRKNTLPINPLIVFFGIFGSFVFSNMRSRILVGTFCLTAIILGFIISIFKPQLELERLIMALSLVLVLPASSLFAHLISSRNKSFISSAVAALVLVLAPNWLWRVSSNQSLEKYTVASPLVRELADKIREHSNDGRTLFAGFSLHELNGGHLAPLPEWSNTPLIAKSFQHDKWKYEDVIPESYRKRKQQGVLEYYDLLNVSLVISQDPFWRKWFRARPEIFEEVWRGGKFQMFKVRDFRNSYFIEGEGEVVSQKDGLLKLRVESANALIKFNFLPFLKVKGCAMKERKINQDVSFIELLSCEPNSEVLIEAKNVIERFLH